MTAEQHPRQRPTDPAEGLTGSDATTRRPADATSGNEGDPDDLTIVDTGSPQDEGEPNAGVVREGG